MPNLHSWMPSVSDGEAEMDTIQDVKNSGGNREFESLTHGTS